MLTLFPIHLYVKYISTTEILQEKLFPLIFEMYENNPSSFPDAWDADVFTTYGKEIDIDWKSVFEHYVPHMVEFGNQQALNGEIDVANAWINAYKSGQSQEIHDHLPGQFSAIHYLKYNPKFHSPTVFINPYGRCSSPHRPPFDTTINQVPPMWVGQQFIHVNEGDLLIFPSFLEHKVPRQTSDEMRITVSFNFNFLDDSINN
jgi:uncharacterized protein (TIGR02466 family)